MSKELLNRKFKVLSRYLPYNLEVDYKGETYSLIGLSILGQKSANILRLLSSDAGIHVPLSEVTPILRPFSHLNKVIAWKAKAVVPCVHLSRVSLGDDDSSYDYEFGDEIFENDSYYMTARNIEDGEELEIQFFRNDYDVLTHDKNTGERYCSINQNKFIQTLYSMHFAVSLDPKEYKKKEIK